MCSPAEQRLWSRLAVFPGGADLETAEEVCAGEGIAPEDIIELIAALVEHSILTAHPSATGMRYHMLHLVRAYGVQPR
ncbi:hypothetical protein ACFQGX_41565 [Nonomuraea dietziae]|uniref:hypothetical protein n=1 Tax=Nonomuraea dietziae TaxID=65515 RepID=UPI00361B4667